MADRTFLCRCEDVTRSELDHAIALGMTTIEELKRYTGFGTGPCQGKECLATLGRELVRRKLIAAEDLQPFTARPPIEPVSFAALATVPDPFRDEGEP